MSQQDLIFSHLQHRHAAAFQNRLLSLKCKAVLCRDLARPDGVLADDEPIALPLGRFIEIGRSADRFVLRDRSEEHTSELQSLMRISYAVFCLKKKKQVMNTTLYIQDTQSKVR